MSAIGETQKEALRSALAEIGPKKAEAKTGASRGRLYMRSVHQQSLKALESLEEILTRHLNREET